MSPNPPNWELENPTRYEPDRGFGTARRTEHPLTGKRGLSSGSSTSKALTDVPLGDVYEGRITMIEVVYMHGQSASQTTRP